MVKMLVVRRKAYVKKSGVRVKAATFKIRDRGAPGRGKKLFKVKKGKLGVLGYSTAATQSKRRTAIGKAVKKHGALSTFRSLNAQVLFRKRQRDSAKKVFKADRDYVKRKFLKG